MNLHGPEDGLYGGDQPLVFLAGPCRGAPQWQKELASSCEDVPVVFANPRREVLFAGDDYDSYLDQVGWEFDHLELASNTGTIVFHLPPEENPVPGRSYAQTTRYELAEWITRKTFEDREIDIVISLMSGFHGGKYIRYRAQKAHSNLVICDSLNDVTNYLKNKYLQ